MSIFGFYFVTTLLKSAGWPKRRGLFSSIAVVDAVTADASTDQMIDWSAALGAFRPKLALQMIAWMFKGRDWDGENAPLILEFIEGVNEKWRAVGDKAPHEIIGAFNLSSQFGTTLRANVLKDDRTKKELEYKCMEGILWGLANPDKFRAWYDSYSGGLNEKLPSMLDAGLEVGHNPTLADYVNTCERIVRNYENEVDPLPMLPPRLLEDARTLRSDLTT